MNRQLSQLLHAVHCLAQQRDNPRSDRWKEIPQFDDGLSPRAAWTLLCLVRHRLRQTWLAEIITSRLGADLRAIAVAGALGHPDGPQKGLVPNATEWEYFFHGRGCCFTHRVTGERIDVDFFDDTADWFDRYFYIWYLKSLKAPLFAEERLLVLCGAAEPVVLSILELVEAGLLVKHADHGCVKLDVECLALEDHMELLESLWSTESGQIAVSASLGDWLHVAEKLEPDDPDAGRIQQLADQARNIYNSHLETIYLSNENSDLALQAMAGVTHPKLNSYLKRAIRGEPSGTMSRALDIIVKLPGPQWHEPLFRLLGRVDPNSEIPAPHVWIATAGYLLRHGYRTGEVLKRLIEMQSHELGEAAILALEFMPAAAIDLFRRALRSTIPYNRMTASAALAIIDASWSRDELAAVLRESDDQLATAECRAALMISRSVDMHRVAEEWQQRNPREPEAGPFYSMEEMSLRNRGTFIQWEMHKLHDRVLPLRSRILPKPDSGWKWLPRWLRGG